MQPTPPKSRKPGYRRPFYDAGKKTSAEIVSEARNTMKILETSRPYTPIESTRRLFGNSSRTPDGRPPSVFRYLNVLVLFTTRNEVMIPCLIVLCY